MGTVISTERTYDRLLDRRGVGRSPAVFVFVLVQVVSDDDRFPWDPEAEGSHQEQAGKTFSPSGVCD